MNIDNSGTTASTNRLGGNVNNGIPTAVSHHNYPEIYISLQNYYIHVILERVRFMSMGICASVHSSIDKDDLHMLTWWPGHVEMSSGWTVLGRGILHVYGDLCLWMCWYWQRWPPGMHGVTQRGDIAIWYLHASATCHLTYFPTSQKWASTPLYYL